MYKKATEAIPQKCAIFSCLNNIFFCTIKDFYCTCDLVLKIYIVSEKTVGFRHDAGFGSSQKKHIAALLRHVFLSACVLLLTRCVQWAKCYVWGQR